MKAKFQDADALHTFVDELDGMRDKIRFTFQRESRVTSRFSILTFRNIRLKESKLYCGSHPAQCEINGISKPRKAKFLEGADWIAFNDMMNDIADKLGLSVDIASLVCCIRKGEKRRYNYDYTSDTWGNNQWEKEGSQFDYINNIHQAPLPSTFPEGTPGSAHYWFVQQEMTD
jgi:hypothetical protein